MSKKRTAEEVVAKLDAEVIAVVVKKAEESDVDTAIDAHLAGLKLHTKLDEAMDFLNTFGTEAQEDNGVCRVLLDAGIPGRLHEVLCKKADSLQVSLLKYRTRLCSPIRKLLRSEIGKNSKKLRKKGRVSTITSRMKTMAEEYKELTGKDFNLKEAITLLAKQEEEAKAKAEAKEKGKDEGEDKPKTFKRKKKS